VSCTSIDSHIQKPQQVIASKSQTKHGEIISKRDDGTVRTKITYRNGMKHGTSYLYYKNGKDVQLEMPYVVGARHGISKKYFETGKLYAETSYEADLLHGNRTTYYRSGQLKAEVPYFRGLPGLGTLEYFKSGNLKTQPALVYRTEGNHLVVKTDKPCRYPVLYIGELVDGRYLDEKSGMEIILGSNGEYLINLEVYTPSYLALQDVICFCKTTQGNPLVIRERILL